MSEEATVEAAEPSPGGGKGEDTVATTAGGSTENESELSKPPNSEVVEGSSDLSEPVDPNKTANDEEQDKKSEEGQTTTDVVQHATIEEPSEEEQKKEETTEVDDGGEKSESGEAIQGEEGKDVKVEDERIESKEEEGEEKDKDEAEKEANVEGDGGEAKEGEGDIKGEEGVNSGSDEGKELIDDDREVAGDAIADNEVDEDSPTRITEEVREDEEKSEELPGEHGQQEARLQHSARPAEESVSILTAIKEEEEFEEDQEELRQELMEQIMQALQEKKKLESQRDKVEYVIAEHLAKKKAEKDQLDIARTVPDARKYAIILDKIRELRLHMEKAQERQSRKEEKLVAKMNSDLEQAKSARQHLIACRQERFVGLFNSRTGKRITVTDLDHYHALEEEKEEEIKKVRLNNIKLAAKMSKLSESLRQKEQLAQGLHMIDFEQLKINNIDLNEKIEERNDDILKLKKKVTSTVQVLTHVKEKLQFLQLEKAERKAALSEIEAKLALKRDELTHLKQARDALRADNQRLKQKGGLVSHKPLLRDFEERIDETEEMRRRLEMLQKRHSELSVMCEGLKRKIETAKLLEAEALANR